MSKTIGGCPAIVRADIGTENGYVQVLLRIMRGVHDDAFAGKGSFIFGKSIANQRIETWWSRLRKECSQYWINVFTQLKDDGIFSNHILNKKLIRFCLAKRVHVLVILKLYY